MIVVSGTEVPLSIYSHWQLDERCHGLSVTPGLSCIEHWSNSKLKLFLSIASDHPLPCSFSSFIQTK